MIVLGVALLVPGILGLLAGFGILWHKPWDRILAFILAAVAVLLGLWPTAKVLQHDLD